MRATVEVELWTPEDLSARWAAGVEDVKEAVRATGLPYVQLGRASRRLS